MTLDIIKRNQAVVERPGYRHLPTKEYEREFGTFSAELEAEGHKPWAFEGKEGYYVPNNVTTFKFVQIDESVRTTSAGSTESGELSRADLDRISDAFMIDLEAYIRGPGHVARGREAALTRVTRGSEGSMPQVDAPAGSTRPAGSPVQMHALSPPVKESEVGPPTGARRPAASRGNAQPTPDKAETDPPGAAEGAPLKGKKQKGSAPTGAGKRGRPGKDWATIVKELSVKFSKSSSSDACFWGAEAKTQIKELGGMSREIAARCRKTKDANEVNQLTALVKEVDSMTAFVTVVKDHGLESEEFKKEYDLQAVGRSPRSRPSAHRGFARCREESSRTCPRGWAEIL